MNKKRVTIIGFGRFGKTLYKLLKDDFLVTVYQRNKTQNQIPSTNNLEEAYKSQTIFYAVPIEAFEAVISEHKKYFRDDHTLIDVLSVKTYPEKIFQKHLKGFTTQAILTHPLFGPDSSKDTFKNLPIVLDKFLATDETYKFWKNYFEGKQLNVIELTAEEHDTIAANSQGLTHFIGRLLQEFDMKQTPIDTVGCKKTFGSKRTNMQ